MESQLEQIRENQKTTWNKFSPGWRKWDVFNMEFLRPMGQTMIELLRVKETDQVLDIATGTGEPGLTIAGLVSKGKVTGTDLSEDMLSIAASHASAKGITNYETKLADCCELPFADNSFDVISCRMGFMFFPDMELAAKEMFRVLKPGGRMATSVWGAPEKNFWIGAMMKVVGKNIELPPPVPGSPGMFRCAVPGLMTGLLAKAGFSHLIEKELTGHSDYETREKYWEIMMDVAAPVVAAMAKADEATRIRTQQELYSLLETHTQDGSLRLGYAAIVLHGEKT
ncbi:class I SAM-dependent methyltransferase [Flavitalea flava]